MPPASKGKKKASKRGQRITTYSGLKIFVEGFVDGKLPLLIVVGGQGLGKSEMFSRGLEGKHGCWMEGNMTSFGMYEQLYKNRDKPVVIDDVDGLCFDRSSISLLKSLCQTKPVKRIRWGSNERYLEGQGLPNEFETRSKVVVITNNWRALNRNVSAVEDRGSLIFFEPSVEEVHEQAGLWFKDREIYEWFGENLHRIESPSFRKYITASDWKSIGYDWKKILGDVPTSKREELAKELLKDESFEGNEERAKAFEKRGGGCRSTFFLYKRKLEAAP